MAASLVPLMGSALNLALPNINAEFSLTASASAWIATSYMLATAIFQIPAARIAEIAGQRRIFIAGVAVFFVFSLLSGFAPDGRSLIAMRFFSGLGSAMIFSTNVALLTGAVPPEKRGWALGINTATVYFSLAAGPLIGGVLTEHFGWHSIFFMAAGIGTILLVVSPFALKNNWRTPGTDKKFGYAGAAIYAAGLFSLIYGFSALPTVHGIILLATGIAIIAYFARHQMRSEHPIFNIRMFLHNRVFRNGCIAALINYSCTMCIAFMLSLYLQYIRALSPTQAGLVLIGQSLVMAVVSLAAGRISDRIDPHKLASSGMIVIAAGLVCFCFITNTTPLALIIAMLAIIGFGFGIFSSPNMNVIMSSVGRAEYGQASATTGTMRLVGQAFSMGLATMALSIFIGNAAISASFGNELLSSMRFTFIISAALCVIGVYASTGRKNNRAHKIR